MAKNPTTTGEGQSAPETEIAKPAIPPLAQRSHRATYARDKKKGGYLVRVEGPNSNAFAGRDVPVTMKDGTEHNETCDRLIWTGKDEESGKPVSLYSMVPKPKEKLDVPF